MDVLDEQRPTVFSGVALTWLAYRTRRRIGPERLVIRASIVIASEAKKRRPRQNQKCRRPRQPQRKPTWLRSEQTIRTTKELGRIKRRKIGPESVMRVLKRRPCGVHDKTRED